MSLLDKASLIVTPNAYKESKLYSVVPNTTLGDMTVVRATTATRVNSAGLIEEVPRNLLQYSQELNNGYWQKVSILVTPNILNDPNGNLTADLVTSTVAGGYINNTNIFGSTGSVYTFSFYIKNNNSTASLVLLRASLSALQSTINWSGNTITSVTNSIGSINFVSVGNDWYRIIGTYTALESNQQLRIYPQSGATTSGVYVWGAQFEQGSTATEYFPTTTRLNIPRIDYTNGSCPSLLVEPQRTNLALNSGGNLSTYNLIENVSNASSSFNSFVNAIQFPSIGLSYSYKSIVITAQTHCFSVFIKMDDNSVPILSSSTTTGNVCLVIAGKIATDNLKVESYGNNIYRLSATGFDSGVNNYNGVLRFDTQVLKSFKTAGFQLELGAYPTSYIPTVASTVTRNADVISKTGISSLIGQTEGTLFSDFNVTNNDLSSDKTIFFVDDNSYYVNIIAARILSNNFLNITFRANSVSVTLTNLPTITNGNHKIAIRYGNGFASIFVDGILRDTKIWTNSFTNSMSQLFIGKNRIEAPYFNDRIKSVQVYKTALSDTECIALTTL